MAPDADRPPAPAEPIDPFEHVDRLDRLDRPPVGGGWIRRWSDRARPWVEWFGVRRLVATSLTVVVLVAGGWWLLRAPAPPTEAGLPHAGAPTTTVARTGHGPPATPDPAAVGGATTTSAAAKVVVHVAGAVAQPGVYELPGGSRADAALAAGGAAPGADPNALNLAAPLVDGERVYVPVLGEPVPPPAAPVPATATSPPGPVDLNRATADELDALPGIGPATAAAIVEHRQTEGPFATVDELEDVRGIGPAKLDAIRKLVTV